MKNRKNILFIIIDRLGINFIYKPHKQSIPNTISNIMPILVNLCNEFYSSSHGVNRKSGHRLIISYGTEWISGLQIDNKNIFIYAF